MKESRHELCHPYEWVMSWWHIYIEEQHIYLSWHAYIHIYIYIWIYPNIYTYDAFLYIHVYMIYLIYIYIYMNMSKYIYICCSSICRCIHVISWQALYAYMYIYIYMYEYMIYLDVCCMQIKSGENTQDALKCRLFSAKEPQIIGRFCGKWPMKIRHPMGLCHLVYLCIYVNIYIQIYIHMLLFYVYM